MMSSPRNNNKGTKNNNNYYKRQLGISNNEESSPEFSTHLFNSNKAGGKKKKSMLPVSPRSATTSNAVALSSGGGSPKTRGGVASPTDEVTKISNAQHYGKGNNKGGSPSTNSKGSSPANNKTNNKTSSPSSSSSPANKPSSPNTSFNTPPIATASNNPPSSPIDKSANSRTTTRSKRMLVVDPKSGQKYNLHEDDHSLTDKELHVYHKKNRKKQQQEASGRKKAQATATTAASDAASSARSRSQTSLQYSTATESHQSSQSQPTTSIEEEETLNTYSTIANDPNYNNEFADEDHTLETASALTEVSYYGRYKFGLYKGSPFTCIIPSSCKSLEQLTLGDLLHPTDGNGGGQNDELDAANEGGGGGKEKEGRDDIESIERGRMKQLLLENNDKSPTSTTNTKKGLKIDTAGANNKGETQEGVLSPISHALQTLLSSPRDQLSSFFPFHTTANNNSNGLQSPEGNIREIKFRRICLVVFPNEVQTSLGNTTTTGVNNNKSNRQNAVGLLGMKFVQNHHDFQAHVSYVQRGSKADRMGVRKGDIVSVSFLLFLYVCVCT